MRLICQFVTPEMECYFDDAEKCEPPCPVLAWLASMNEKREATE